MKIVHLIVLNVKWDGEYVCPGQSRTPPKKLVNFCVGPFIELPIAANDSILGKGGHFQVHRLGCVSEISENCIPDRCIKKGFH